MKHPWLTVKLHAAVLWQLLHLSAPCLAVAQQQKPTHSLHALYSTCHLGCGPDMCQAC